MSRSLTWILIVVAVAGACGRILSSHLVYEPNVSRTAEQPAKMGRAWPAARPRPMPTFSSNDRSRWATIRALVDKDTYEIGQRDLTTMYATLGLNFAAQDGLQAATIAQTGFYLRTRKDEKTGNNSGIIFEDGWESVDKVLDPTTQKFYSSKPPLLSRLLAYLYWLLKRLTEWNLADHPSEVVRTILLLINALPFMLYLWVLARIGYRYAATEWSRMIVLAAAAFGTMVTPFLVTLNNHTIGTFCVLWALAIALRMWEIRTEKWGEASVVPGGADWGQTRSPPALRWHHFFAAGLFASFAVCNELPALAFWAGLLGLFLLWSPLKTLAFYVPASLVIFAAYVDANHAATGRYLPVQAEFGNPWYEYEGSHWRRPEPWEEKDKSGIDWAHLRESKEEYALHLLVGHHGFFSLTPLWLLAILGLLLGVWRSHDSTESEGGWRSRGGYQEDARPLPWWLPLLTLGVIAVVIAFYLYKSDNYGGWTNGPRWLMWLSPLLLVSLYPLLDRLAGSRWGRGLVYLGLFFSVVSASYRPWNPWRHPWLYDAMVWLGWPGY